MTTNQTPARSPLFDAYAGPFLHTPNRIVMAPMTRFRSDPVTGVPGPEVSTYYAQRASAGLIITEGTWVSPEGSGGPGVPGLMTREQADGWRPVTDAVHAAGGRIFAQLWHVGRVGHPRANPAGLEPIAPSAVRAPGLLHLGTDKVPTIEPKAMSRAQIAQTIDAFALAAAHAIEAGFDGVELHGANGYLIQQFLGSNTNLRNDEYGGTLVGRRRFLLDLVERVLDQVGPGRVAVRVSPGNPENGVVEEDPADLYRGLVSHLATRELAYLHVSEKGRYPALADLREHWPHTLIGNYDPPVPSDRDLGERLLGSKHADLVAYGRLFIANPDLPARFARNAEMNETDEEHLYAGGAHGYTDYPFLDGITGEGMAS